MPAKSREGMKSSEKEEKDFHPCLYMHSSGLAVQTMIFLRKNSSFL